MSKGYFGEFGGQFVAELLIPPLKELEDALENIVPSEAFQKEFSDYLKNYVGRESPLTHCPTLSTDLGFNLYLKREDLNHTGSHKINNVLGQALLAKHMGKKALLTETGAGMNGVATATAARALDMDCIVFMGAVDVERQSHNVRRMKLLGATVVPVEAGSKTLKDAINEALRFWIKKQATHHYCFGTAAGPHPFPTLVREFQSVVGKEARKQIIERTGALPHSVIACVGGGSNAIGIFSGFVDDCSVNLIGVEAAGTGEEGCTNSAPLCLGTAGILHGQKTMLLQDADGQIMPSHSIAGGLDYPGVGPEHAHLHHCGRAEYVKVNDMQTLHAFKALTRAEGIMPALESSHAVAYVLENKDKFPKGCNVIVNLSGRGDKDMDIVEQYTELFD
ncbi:tryptophan synthase subunit beta [Halodesulfovibrio spirochaetisodalis]|uniref:Tryptophan synthase beta chain n=1 Tax=Halodesulfovibrio spirochaetisodalis TaxID=1560234 RepID=A0A1B7XGB1_9BACT|nr:tryptophan synthase subunit beta [Halodesulfovibrio spirochaetisodalis]OBQ54550.1 tryptophan synthase subunit beta [Halodesulfovibrio spirochaetisodalis]